MTGTVRGFLVAACALVLSGCLGPRDGVVSVTDVDGSADHRIFRLGAATRLMLEPVLWRLEDRKIIDFDRPVTEYFKDKLPPEYETVTLRMLHDNESGLPLNLIDAWSLGGMGELFGCAAFGDELYRGFNSRESFVERLWDIRFRKAVERREPQPSNVGFALLMMAICDRTGATMDWLCERYLIRPYGLKDTSFVPRQGVRGRLTRSVAGSLPWFRFAGSDIPDHRGEGEVKLFSGGMLSSPSDILKVAFVILPHLDRAKALFETREICGRTVSYIRAGTLGGRIFIGFEPQDAHVALLLRNDTGLALSDGFELMENLINPPQE